MMSPMDLLLLMVVVLLSRVTVFTQTSYNVKGTVGDNVILICSTSENITDIEVVTVEWRREKSLVLVFRSGKQVPEIQDSHFEGRAELVYSDLKAGNLSMVLKNVTPRDSGIYSCSFFRDLRGDVSQLSTTNLKVADLTVTCSSELKAIESSNVTLNCTVSPWKDLSEDGVRWSLEWRHEDKKEVHYTSQKDDLNQQHKQFKNRTSLNKTELKHGKIVLTIFNVTVDDTGNYICFLHFYDEADKLHQYNGFVKLEVTERYKNQLGEQGTDTNDSNSTGGNLLLVGSIVSVIVGGALVAVILVLWKKGCLRSCARGYSETPQNDPQPQEVEVPLQQRPQEQPNNDELNPERDE